MNRDSSPRRRSKAGLRALLDSKEVLVRSLIQTVEKLNPTTCLLCEKVPERKPVSKCPKCSRNVCRSGTECSVQCYECRLVQCSECIATCSNQKCGDPFCEECMATPRCTECGDVYCRKCNFYEDCNVKDCPFCKGGKRPFCVDCMPFHIRDTHDRQVVDRKHRERPERHS